MSPRPSLWFAAAAVAIALPFGIAWPLGGLEDAAGGTPPRITLGQQVKGHLYEMTPRRAFTATKDPNPSFGAAKPGRFVVLDLDVTNVSTMPASVNELLRDVEIHVDGRPLNDIESIKDQLIVRKGDTRGSTLNPRLPEQVRLVWELPKDAPPARTITVAISDEEYQPSWSLLGYASGTSLWYRQGVIATLQAPLEAS
ncbi:MAG: hypothetical protein HOY71_00375 [Nonomuraea sp.]|nr:hypothetical protein [Nonomuraea sp.]